MLFRSHSEIHAGVRNIPESYEVFNDKFLSYESIQKYDECPICKSEKPIKQKYCSHKCAQLNSRKVDWDSVDLLELMKTNKISELEVMFNVSNAAIYKRRNKILNQLK